MFTFIDNWLLDSVFQKAADWFRDNYGKTPHWIAATCALGYLVFFLGGNVLEDQTMAGVVWDTLLGLSWLLIAFILDFKDKEEQNVLTRTMNPWRISPIIKFVRIFTVIILMLDVPIYGSELLSGTMTPLKAGLDVAKDVMFCAVYYFGSCSTKPPSLKPVEKPAEVPANGTSEAA